MIETVFAKTRLMGRVVGDPRGGWRLPVVRRLILATVLCLLALLALTTSASAATSFTNTSPITIPNSGNASPYPSEINVGGLTGPITDISVTLHRFGHKFPSEVDILLISPGGKGVILMSDACSNAGNIEDFTWTFSQSAPGPMSGDCSAFTYRPTNVSDGDFWPQAPGGPYSTSLDAFDNQAANGSWRLFVVDDTGDDGGDIEGG